MDYLVYILAGFGIFSILVLILKLILWSLKCDIDKQFIPIGESEVYTMRSSVCNINEKEAIEQMDQMLEQYTKPKVVVSRQCICPVCSKETERIIINDLNCNETEDQNKPLIEESTGEESEEQRDNVSIITENTVIEVNDIVIIEDSKEEMPCNMYNNVVSELKKKFTPNTGVEQQNSDQNNVIEVIVESTDM